MSKLRKACSLCYLSAKNFYNQSKFGKVLTKNKFAQFFWDTVYTTISLLPISNIHILTTKINWLFVSKKQNAQSCIKIHSFRGGLAVQ